MVKELVKGEERWIGRFQSMAVVMGKVEEDQQQQQWRSQLINLIGKESLDHSRRVLGLGVLQLSLESLLRSPSHPQQRDVRIEKAVGL